MSNSQNLDSLLGPIENFTLRETGSGLEVTPFKSSTYFWATFLVLSATFIFYMSLDPDLKSRPFAQVFLWAIGLTSLYCSFHVLKKGSGMLRFNQGGQFIEHLDGDGKSQTISVQSESLSLIKETITNLEGASHDQFRLLAEDVGLLMSKKLETIENIVKKIEILGFSVNR
ncbi:MAG: hypothetical protein H7Z71_05725 [Moraxellaceae bacterium]|nr:hypothetical protein [Pseudobdellovibrionaceae bacterium]